MVQVPTPTHVRVAYRYVHIRVCGCTEIEKMPERQRRASSFLSPEENWFGFCVGDRPGMPRKRRRAPGNLIRQNTRPCSPYLLALPVGKLYTRNEASTFGNRSS